MKSAGKVYTDQKVESRERNEAWIKDPNKHKKGGKHEPPSPQ